VLGLISSHFNPEKITGESRYDIGKKKIILTSFALLLPVTAYGDVTVKFFPGWSYRHQDDQIDDGE
jgi:hypothetical protein